jgi:hypothetical protein
MTTIAASTNPPATATSPTAFKEFRTKLKPLTGNAFFLCRNDVQKSPGFSLSDQARFVV